MARKINESSTSPGVYEFARLAVRDAREFDQLGEVRAVGRAIKRRVRFTRDPVGAEALQDPEDTLKLGSGDCDDLSILAGATLQSLGYPVSLEVVGMKNPNHVFLNVETQAGRVPLDLARPDRRFTAPQPLWKMRSSFPLALAQAVNDSRSSRRNITPLHFAGSRAHKKRSLRDAAARARSGRGERIAGPNLAALTGEDVALGSWLSETVNKVVGKKAGKSLEKGVKGATGALGTGAASIARLLPGGEILAKGITMATTAGAIGQDPRKMSWNTINTIAAQDPELGAQLAQQKQAYEQERAAAKANKKVRKQNKKLAAAGLLATAPAPAPAASSGSSMLPLAIGAGALLLLTMKK